MARDSRRLDGEQNKRRRLTPVPWDTRPRSARRSTLAYIHDSRPSALTAHGFRPPQHSPAATTRIGQRTSAGIANGAQREVVIATGGVRQVPASSELN